MRLTFVWIVNTRPSAGYLPMRNLAGQLVSVGSREMVSNSILADIQSALPLSLALTNTSHVSSLGFGKIEGGPERGCLISSGIYPCSNFTFHIPFLFDPR